MQWTPLQAMSKTNNIICLQEGVQCLIYVICFCCMQWVQCLIYVICFCVCSGSSLHPVVCRRVPMSYLCYLCLFGSSLPPVVCRRADVLFMLFVFVWFVFTSSCLQEGSCLIYVICVCLVRLYTQLFVGGFMSYLCQLCLFDSSLHPVVCRRVRVLFMLFVFVWFVFTPSCLQEGSCLIYVICVCLVRLYLQLFVVSYLCQLCRCLIYVSRRVRVLFMLFVFVWFVFTPSCLQEGSCLIYVSCVCLVRLYTQLFVGGFMSYLCQLCLFGSSLHPVVCRRVRVLFMLFVFVWFVFTPSCLQEGSCLIYVSCVCLVRLYTQLFVGGFVSYLCYLCLFGSSLHPVVCRRVRVLFMLFVFVWFVFTPSCLQEGSCLIYVICVCLVRLYTQLFVGGFVSYLCQLCLFGSSLPPVVCRRVHVLFMLFVFVWFVFTSSCLQEGSCLIYVSCVCLVRLYTQLFVGGFVSYLCYLCLFGSSLPPVVCRRVRVLFMLVVFVWFVFTPSCLQEGSCLIYVICVCLVRLYLQLFVGGFVSYLCQLCLFGSSLHPVVCRRVRVLFMLFVFVWFVFTSSCLQEGSCLIYVSCVCLVRLYTQLFVGGFVSYLCQLCLFGSSLPPVVCRRVRVLFMLVVFVWFVFTPSCLQEGSCLIYVICVCLVRLYLQLFVGGFVSYLCQLCLFGSSLPPVVCRRVRVLFMLVVFVWFVFTPSCLQEGSCLIYVICVCLVRLYTPVVCRRVHVLFMLVVFVWFVFTPSCLQEGSCLIYVICVCLVRLYTQLFVGGFVSYLCYLCLFGSSLPPVVCRRVRVLFMLVVFVWFVFTSSCLQEGSCLIYVSCVCLVRLYTQLFVGGFMSYLCQLCLFGSSLPPVVCRRVHVLFMLFVFVWFVFTPVVCRRVRVLFMLFVFVWFVFTSSCLQEGSCLIYVICVCLVRLYLQLFVGGFMSYLCQLCLFGSSLPPVVCRRVRVLFMLFVFVWFVFTSSCLQEGSCLIYVSCVCLVRLYTQLFVGGFMSYLCQLCLFGSSLPPVVCRRVRVLFMLFVFVWFVFTPSCLQEGSCLIYVSCVCLVRLYTQLFVGGFVSYLCYLCLFGSSLPPVVCRRVHVLFMLVVFVWFVFTPSCLQEGSCLIYVSCVCLFVFVCLVRLYLQLFVGGFMSYLCQLCLFGSSLHPVVCRRVRVLFMLVVFVWFVFTSSCLQEGSCLIYVSCVCLVRLYLQLFVGGFMSYLCQLCLFGSSLHPVVCRRVRVLFMLVVFVWFVFTPSCLQEGSCLIYVSCVCLVRLYTQLFVGGFVSYLCQLCLFGSSLHPVVCRRVRVLFMLVVFVWFVFTSSCLQEGSCLIYVSCVCLVRLYLQLFVGGFVSYLCQLCLFGSSLHPVVCRRVRVLFMLVVFVWFVFTSSCLQEGSCLIYVSCVCLVRLYLQLFVGGFMSYLCQLCLFGSSLPPVVCRRVHVLFMLVVFVWFVFTPSCLQEGSCLIYVICVCLVRLYTQLFVGGFVSYLCYLCLFGSSLHPVVCRRVRVLFMLFVFVWFVFTPSCLQEGSCLIYVSCVCLVRLYTQLFVGGFMSYLCQLCLFGSSLHPVVCRRVRVLFMLFVFVWFVFTPSCLQEGSCLIYVICVCLVRLYTQLFVGGFVSYLCYLCLFGSSLHPVVCRRVRVLFMLFVFVWFVFTPSCLQEGSCLIYVSCVCLVRLYLQLFVGGFVSYLCYLCLFGSSLPPVVCRRVRVLFMLFVFVWFVFTPSCLQEGSCLIYVSCVCLIRLYTQLFVGGFMSYLCQLCLFGSSLPPVVCRRVRVLFMLVVFVWFVFTPSCLQEGSCLIYVICVCLVRLYTQLFVGGFMSYLCQLCLFGSSLHPVVCRRVRVLFMLVVFVWFVFTPSCLQEGSCLIYVICVCLVRLYTQLFVGGFVSYLCQLCLFGSSLPPVVCRRVRVLFMLVVFVWFVFTSSCLQEGSCLIYVSCVCLVRLYTQLFVGGFVSYLCQLCLFGSSLPPVVCRRVRVLFMLVVFVWFVFTPSCLQEGSCLIYVSCVCLVRLYTQLFVGGFVSYLCQLCLFGSSLHPVVCRRVRVLFMLVVFVWFVFTPSCLQEGSCLIYVSCVCLVRLYLQLFVGGFVSYLCQLCLFGSSLHPVVCRRVRVLFMLVVFVWFVFTSSCLQEGSCLIYVSCVCLVRLYTQLFVGGFVSYLCQLCLFGSSLPPVVCRRVRVLFMLVVFVWFVFTSSCLQEGSCLIYVSCVCLVRLYTQLFVGGFVSYLCQLCLFGSSLHPVVCRRVRVLFMLVVFVWFVFTPSCLQEGSCLIYVSCVCLVRLYLQLFVGGFVSYLCQLCLFGSSLHPVVCRRVRVLFMLVVFVWFVFTSQLFVGGFVSYLCQLCLFGSSLPPVVCRRVRVLFMLVVFVWFVFTPVVCRRVRVLFMLVVFVWFVFTSSCLQEGSCLIYVSCVCLVRLYTQLFVGGFVSYLCYLCLFGSSLPPVVCRRVRVLFMLFVFVWFLYLQLFVGGFVSYLRLYLQLFVGGFVSYLCYLFVWFVFVVSYLCQLCLFGSSLPPVVCRRVHVLFMLVVFVWFVFTSSCLQEGSCLIYVSCVCLVRLYTPVVCRRVRVLFMLVVFVWFVFTPSCLQEGSFVSYLCQLCLFGSSLHPVVCRRVRVLFMLVVFVWFVFTSSCLQEGSCLIYVSCMCLFGSSLHPVVCRRVRVLFMLVVFVWFVFTPSCLQEGSCLIYVSCVCLVRLYTQLFVGGFVSYLCQLCLFGSSLHPVVCRRVRVLFMLFVFVWFVFTPSCLQEGSCLIYVSCVCLVRLYTQLFVGGFVSYLCQLCLFGSSLHQLFVGGFVSYLCQLCLFGSSLPPVVCRRVRVLFMLVVFVWFVFTSSCLQEGSCLIYVSCVCLVRLYTQLFVGGFSLIYVSCVCLVRLYTQLFVGGFVSYLCYLCLFIYGSSLHPVVCRRVRVLFMLVVLVRLYTPVVCRRVRVYLCSCVCLVRLYLQLFVGGFSCLQEGSCLIYVSCVCLVRLIHPVVCRRVHVLFMLGVWFVFTCLSYLCQLCLFGSSLPPVVCRRVRVSYLCQLCLFGSSLPPVVCRRVRVFVFTSSLCRRVRVLFMFVFTRLYQLFVGGFVSYLCQLCLFGSSLHSSCLQEGSCLIYVSCVCLVRLYLQLFVGGFVSYLCQLCLFGSSLHPVVCRRVRVLFMLVVFVWFVFTSRFVGGFVSYLCQLCLFGSSLHPVVCRRVRVLFMLFVFVWFVFTPSCLQEGSCLIYVICVCLVRLYTQLFVGGFVSYLCYLCLFGSSLHPVVCRRVRVLFMLFVFVWFVFTPSCLQEGSCLIYVICVCLVRLYTQLFVGGFVSYLCQLSHQILYNFLFHSKQCPLRH